MKKICLLTLFVMLSFLTACQQNERHNGEDSTTMSSTSDFWEDFRRLEREGKMMNDLPTNGGPSPREKDVVEGMAVPDEILEIAKQKFEHYFLLEDLVVETRSYHTSEGEENRVVVELLDNLQTKEDFTAFLDESGQIDYYKFSGDYQPYLYDFIKFEEDSEEIQKEIGKEVLAHTGVVDDEENMNFPSFHKQYQGKRFDYDVDYNMARTGINRFIVEITYREKK